MLAILLLSANDVVATDRLVDELWGERPPKTAVKTVHVYVSRLRKRLGADAIVTRPPGYALSAADDQIDQRRFERLADHGRGALARGNAPLARRLLAEALGLWRGAALSDFAYEAFAQAEAARLNELRLATLEDRIDADLQCGQADELVAELYALTARQPLRERFRGQLMLSLYRSGREAEALDVYHDARRTLLDELGIEPSRQLEGLQRAILAHDAALERPRGLQAARAPGLLVGRDSELRTALQALTDASERRGRVLLLSGEAGIGKSRLADEVAACARDEGMHVLRGACWEAGGAPAYWPWVQLLRAYLASAEPEQLRRLLGSRAPELAELLPDLRELVDDIPRPSVRDPEALRFRLFDAVASFLGAVADRERPLLVVLDDLHAADESSLLLLGFVANAIRERGVVVLGAYRDTMLGPEHALGRLLGDLLCEPHVARIPLDGLRPEDVRTYVELSTGRRVSPELIEALHGRTVGNPLFVVETVRLLEAADDLDSGEIQAAVPAGVREAVDRRLQGLPDAARGVLSAASVLGREFDPEILERVAGNAAVAAVDHAIAARLVTAAPGAPGALRFSHALVRDVLYQAIPSPHRRQLHLQVARTLERRHAADLGLQLAQLAHHCCEAADNERARDYARRAAELAASRLAYEEAARLYRLALRLFEACDETEEEELCELVLGLGDVQARAGDDSAAKSTFLRAAEVARRCGLADQLGRAALGYGGRWVWTKGRGDPHLLPLLEEAVSALPPEDSALRSRLLARLAAGPLVLQSDASRPRRFALTAEAVDIARRIGDPAVLAWALDARKVAIWAPDTLEEQWEIMDELRELAERVGDPEQIVDAQICRLIKLIERAELDRFDAEFGAARHVAETLGQPGQRWLVAVHEPMYALLTGSLAGVGRLIEQAFQFGRSSIPWNARMSRLRQRVVLATLEGRPGEVESELAAAAEEEVYYPSVRAALASLYAELGDASGCRAALRALSADGFAAIPFDDVWVMTLGLLADACSFLGDGESATTLYERLEPYAHRNLVAPVEASLGSAARPLGKLAATLGDVRKATRWFERAARENERSGALPFAAHARLDHARLLLAAGEHASGEALLEHAAAGYRTLGMESWAARCEVATTAA